MLESAHTNSKKGTNCEDVGCNCDTTGMLTYNLDVPKAKDCDTPSQLSGSIERCIPVIARASFSTLQIPNQPELYRKSYLEKTK